MNMTMKITAIIAAAFFMLMGQVAAQTTQKEKGQLTKIVEMKQLNPKNYTTFKVGDNVELYAVSFQNQYKMKVAGHLFIPKNLDRNKQNPAIIVGHPMGAVKEQSADVYAANMAERGFITLVVDLSFWGESEGATRNAVLPDVYAEDFSAAVDFLGTRSFVDRNRIGIIGVCGSGSFVISAAKIDPRMKAVATVSMYDMGAASRNALNKSQTLEQRKNLQLEAAEQRYAETAHKGDVVLCPPDTDHWHGASSTSQMTHVVITNYKGDSQVNWLKPVTDEEYKTEVK